MEGAGNDKPNVIDVCDNKTNGKMHDRDSSDDTTKDETLENTKNDGKSSNNITAMTSEQENKLEKRLSHDDEPEDDEEKVSDEEQESKKIEEKRDDESSTTSTSTTDDESETSSEDKTDPSVKPEDNIVAIAVKFEEKNDDTNKIDDTTDDSDIDDDLVTTINYNTITSLAALKDMLQCTGEDDDGVDSFFHHYFLSHVNRLPSRNQTHSPYPWGRRLSECREEDEYETEDGKNIF